MPVQHLKNPRRGRSLGADALAAGLAGLHHAGEHRAAPGLTPRSRVLALVTEGPEEPA